MQELNVIGIIYSEHHKELFIIYITSSSRLALLIHCIFITLFVTNINVHNKFRCSCHHKFRIQIIILYPDSFLSSAQYTIIHVPILFFHLLLIPS